MTWIAFAIASILLFHLWLYLWYFPKHCLSDRKVTLGERYRAFMHFILRTIRQQRNSKF
jgi:hypothetical protein